jgi:hypothetical protein
MSRSTTFLLWVAIGSLAGVLGVQSYLSRTELRQAETERMAGQKNLARAEAALVVAKSQWTRLAERLAALRQASTAEQQLTPEERIIEALRGKLAELERRYPKAERPPPLTNPFGPNRAAELIADPAYAQLYRTWYRARIEQDYNELLATIRAPQEVKARLVELLLDRQLAIMDVIGLTGASRWGPGNPPTKNQEKENRRARQAVETRFAAEIESLLDTEAFAQFRQYQVSDGQRRDIAAVASRLSYTDHPLTADQRQQLTARLQGSFLTLSDNAKAEQVIAGLGHVLSPEQLELVRQLRREKLAALQRPTR